jgi:hypothetical protein
MNKLIIASTIVEAVGMAHQAGKNTWRRDLNRSFKRTFIRLLYERGIPEAMRDRLLEIIGRTGDRLFNSGWLLSGASKGNTFEADCLKLFFNATAIADLAADDQSGPATTLTVALHTADPGETGTQATSVTAYTGYANVTVARTTGGWAVSGTAPTVVSPVANIDFGECTASAGGAITHFSVGTGVSNYLMYSGTVTPNITMAVGVIPRIKTTSTISED